MIGYTVETDGTLPSRERLADAIEQTDAVTGGYPTHYMVNCAHPSHFGHAVVGGAPWTRRIAAVRANASTLSHAELDEATVLDDGDPADLAERYVAIRASLPSLHVVGGCCGTDHRHVAAIASAFTSRSASCRRWQHFVRHRRSDQPEEVGMRRMTIVLGIVAVLGAGVFVGAVTPATARDNHERFTVIAQDSEGTITPADFGTNPSPNQQAALDAPVYREGVKVGLAETLITLTRVTDEDHAAIIECSVELPKGNILFNGSFHFGDLATGASVPVVGGTGSYSGFVGTVTMTVAPDNSYTTLAFDIEKA